MYMHTHQWGSVVYIRIHTRQIVCKSIEVNLVYCKSHCSWLIYSREFRERLKNDKIYSMRTSKKSFDYILYVMSIIFAGQN